MARKNRNARGNTRGTSRGGGTVYARNNGSTKKIVAITVLLLVIAALTVVTLLCGYAARDPYTGRWFKNADLASWTLKDNSPKDYLSIESYSLSVDDFEEYGVSRDALAAKNYNVVFNPTDATNRRIEWKVYWSGTKSAWSSNKELSDYVDLIAGENYAPTATLALKQPFGDTIILEAASLGNSRIKSTIDVDYVARYDNFLDSSALGLEYGEDINLIELVEASDDTYTVVPDSFTVSNVTVQLDATLGSGQYTDVGTNFSFAEIINSYYTEPQKSEYISDLSEGIIHWDYFIRSYLTEQALARFIINEGQCEWGTITATVTCCYRGEEMYSFTANLGLEVTDDCVEQMSNPVQSVQINPGWSAF